MSKDPNTEEVNAFIKKIKEELKLDLTETEVQFLVWYHFSCQRIDELWSAFEQNRQDEQVINSLLKELVDFTCTGFNMLFTIGKKPPDLDSRTEQHVKMIEQVHKQKDENNKARHKRIESLITIYKSTPDDEDNAKKLLDEIDVYRNWTEVKWYNKLYKRIRSQLKTAQKRRDKEQKKQEKLLRKKPIQP